MSMYYFRWEFKEVPQKERRKMINIKHGLFPDVRDDMKNDMTVQIFSMPKCIFSMIGKEICGGSYEWKGTFEKI